MITKYKTLIQSEKLMINANNPDPDGSYYTYKNLQKIKIQKKSKKYLNNTLGKQLIEISEIIENNTDDK